MNKYTLIYSTKFKKDVKRYLRNKKEMGAIRETLELLASNGNEAIPLKMKPHKLIGNYSGCWECHIFPDLLIVWEQEEAPKEIYLVRIGSHSDLF